mgnify:CR=1 FL=1
MSKYLQVVMANTSDTTTELNIKTTVPSDMVLLSGLFEYNSLGVKPLIPLPLVACTCGRLMERKDVSQEPKSTTLEPRNLGRFNGSKVGEQILSP